MVLLIDRLIKAIHEAATYNSDVQAAPHCILWPDRDRQWEAVIPTLQQLLPELYVLGRYNPELRKGPAIWLRCVIAGQISEPTIPEGKTPILYLPDVGRQDLRAVESCRDELKPLAELQYRGTTWTQIANGKDWTVLAFLKSNQGGLGLDVALDQETKGAMLLALSRILDEDLSLLEGKHLDKDYFNSLLTERDHTREVLQWLDQGDDYRDSLDRNSWKAFIALTKSRLGFEPDKEGTLEGGKRLASRKGPWLEIWQRFEESARRFPNIPQLLRRCTPPKNDMLWAVSIEQFGGWPQWNEEREDSLRESLLSLREDALSNARKKVLELEKAHKSRRQIVWAELGEAPLALALEHLATLTSLSSDNLSSGDFNDLATGYQTFGWQTDNAVVQSLSLINTEEDLQAVTTAIRALYLPWIEDSAKHLQTLSEKGEYPGNVRNSTKSNQNECVLFVDGLRFDLSKRLAENLTDSNCKVEEQPVWAALPSVTATGKPAVSPVRNQIKGLEANSDFEPVVAETDQSLKGGYHLKKLLSDNGWEVLERTDSGTGEGNSWCEYGDIDSEGHERGWKLSKHVDNLLLEIQERVLHLLTKGRWTSVRIVTDHGWLLLPGGLPALSLHTSLTENKWGRCAALKAGAKSGERLYPWYWNSAQQFVLADGVHCFRNGYEYAHGGLSLQECLNLELVVSLQDAQESSSNCEITDIGWKGLRCVIAIAEQQPGLIADLRQHPGDKSTSIVVKAKEFNSHGTTSLIVEDEDKQGSDAYVVILNEHGDLLTQEQTIVGGDEQW